MRLSGSLAAFIAVGALMSGCGSDEDALDEAVRALFDAYNDGDIDAVSDLYSERCKLSDEQIAVNLEGWEDIKVISVEVKIDGDRSEYVRVEGEPDVYDDDNPGAWLKEDGEWKYNDC